jgi:FkbM family methyltransferase
MKQTIKKLFSLAGYQISKMTPDQRLSDDLIRRRNLVQHFGIDTVLDVGANSGQYARQMRSELGYQGSIISFEPLSSAFAVLEESATGDPDWEVLNIALGDKDKSERINIAGNSYSSSLLDMLPSHLNSAPQSKYVGSELIVVKKLDSIYGEICGQANNVYLKIDAQGYESKILEGAKLSLIGIDTIQMELSLVPLYDGEVLFNEMYMHMSKNGYTLVSIEPGFSDPSTDQLLQVDGIFHRL